MCSYAVVWLLGENREKRHMASIEPCSTVLVYEADVTLYKTETHSAATSAQLNATQAINLCGQFVWKYYVGTLCIHA